MHEVFAALQEQIRDVRRRKQESEAMYLEQICRAIEESDMRRMDSSAASGSGAGAGCSRAGLITVPRVPPYMLCPITECIMREPVKLKELGQSGNTFERSAIKSWLSVQPTDPHNG